MKRLNYIYIAGFMLLVPILTQAQTGFGNNQTVGFGNNVGLTNPLKVDSICKALKLFLDALLTLGVPVAVLFLVYAGFLFVWVRGSKDGLVHARRNFFYTVVGIAIFMGAWVLGQIIANTLSQLGGNANPSQQIGQCN